MFLYVLNSLLSDCECPKRTALSLAVSPPFAPNALRFLSLSFFFLSFSAGVSACAWFFRICATLAFFLASLSLNALSWSAFAFLCLGVISLGDLSNPSVLPPSPSSSDKLRFEVSTMFLNDCSTENFF